MSVEITYMGNTIATVDTSITKALRTEGKYCPGDISVINTQDQGVLPTGKIEITENGDDIDVASYSLAKVNVQSGEDIFVAPRYGTLYTKEMNATSSRSTTYLYADATELVKYTNRTTTSGANTAFSAYMFSGCIKLEEVWFPNTIIDSYCGNYVFNGCSTLKKVEIGGIEKPSSSIPNWMFRATTASFDLILYFNVETLTEAMAIPGVNQIHTWAPNCTFIFKNSTTGEVLE